MLESGPELLQMAREYFLLSGVTAAESSQTPER